MERWFNFGAKEEGISRNKQGEKVEMSGETYFKGKIQFECSAKRRNQTSYARYR